MLFLLIVLFHVASASWDPCMVRIHDVMIPKCIENVCSMECCDSLAFPEHEDCSAHWREIYMNEADEFWESRNKCDRPCVVRHVCPFTTQSDVSPCFYEPCDVLFDRGVLTSECSVFVQDYCKEVADRPSTNVDDRPCMKFTENMRKCGSSSPNFGKCSRDSKSFLETCTTNFTDLSLVNEVPTGYVSTECYRWLVEYGCDGHECPCRVVNEKDDGYSVTVCALEVFSWSLAPDFVRLLWAPTITIFLILAFCLYDFSEQTGWFYKV